MTFHKYWKIHQLGKEENKDIFSNPDDIIVIEEKIDGANFRFMIKDGRIIFGSHNRSIGDDTQEIGGNWKRCIEFIKERLKYKKLSDFEGLIFYGECCIKHTIPYDWATIPPFLGFDIMNIESGKYLYNKNDLFYYLGLPTVPYITTVQARGITAINDEIVPKSQYYNGQAEGVVFKNYEKQIFGKYVRAAFKEDNKKVFGITKKFAENDNERLVATYCTNARVDKIIFKLLDEGEGLGLPLMQKLPKLVSQDIFEENWREIYCSKWTIDFKEVYKMITHRCLEVLKQMITNNTLNQA